MHENLSWVDDLLKVWNSSMSIVVYDIVSKTKAKISQGGVLWSWLVSIGSEKESTRFHVFFFRFALRCEKFQLVMEEVRDPKKTQNQSVFSSLLFCFDEERWFWVFRARAIQSWNNSWILDFVHFIWFGLRIISVINWWWIKSI